MKKRILNAIEEAESYGNVTKCSGTFYLKNQNHRNHRHLQKNYDQNRITVCFDIEAYFDPEIENKQNSISYLCCVCF